MLNIITTQNGFNLNENQYIFEGDIEVISESQCHVPTNEGVILLDLSCTINKVSYTDMNLFLQELQKLKEQQNN
jgi:hypothetical protein